MAGYQPFLDGEFSLGGVVIPWVWAGLPRKGLSPPIESRPQRVVTKFKNVQGVSRKFH